MTTDNRTNEELATRLRQIAESQAMDFDSPHVAMTLNEVADRLSGTATEAQVEAAAKAMHETGNPWFAAYGDWGAAGFEIKKAFRESARAALVAAQGAAPQAPAINANCMVDADGCEAGTAPQAEMPGRQELGQTIRNKFNEARGRSGVDPWALADLILEEHPALAAPVLPSSTVDEDALAEVIEGTIRRSWETFNNRREGSQVIARAVGEWLKEQGR